MSYTKYLAFIGIAVTIGFTIINSKPSTTLVEANDTSEKIKPILANTEIIQVNKIEVPENISEKLESATAPAKVEAAEDVAQISLVSEVKQLNQEDSEMRDRLVKFMRSKNKAIDAEAYIDACIATRLNCRLVVAMSGQESGFCNVYRLRKNGVWRNYRHDQIAHVTNKLTDNQIKFNCSGVKSRAGKGGNNQPMSDGFSGSIIGYDSFEDFMKHKEEFMSKHYQQALKDDVTLGDIQNISRRYVKGNGIVKPNWSNNVYKFYNQI